MPNQIQKIIEEFEFQHFDWMVKEDRIKFIREQFTALLHQEIQELENMRKHWKPTCGYESEEEKGFQKGIMAEQRLNNQCLSDLITKKKELINKLENNE